MRMPRAASHPSNWLVLGCAWLMMSLPGPASAYKYVIQDLGAYGNIQGSPVLAWSLSDSGHVGISASVNGLEHSWLWRKGVATHIGTGPTYIPDMHMVNNSGVVGLYVESLPTKGAYWKNGAVHPLPANGAREIQAIGINNDGWIVGTRFVDGPSYSFGHGFIYETDTGTFTDLGYPGGTEGQFQATVIGDSADIIGFDTQNYQPWVYVNGWHPLPKIAGTYSTQIFGANKHSHLVGYGYLLGGNSSNGIYYGGTWHPLAGGAPAQAVPRSINDFDDVVGYAADGGGQQACLWKDGQFHFLRDLVPPNSGWILRMAAQINNLGQIVGMGEHNGQLRAFLITDSALVVTSPVAGGNVVPGAQYAIEWSPTTTDTLIISLSTDARNGVDKLKEIGRAPGSDGTFPWTPPDTLTRWCQVRVANAQDTSRSAYSGIFTIKGYQFTRLGLSDDEQAFRVGTHDFSFINTSAMWPQSWWSQFNYQGIDPHTAKPYPGLLDFDLTFKYKPSNAFPDWPAFVDLFGENACYWNKSQGVYKSSAENIWKEHANNFFGSCAGFAVGSIVGFDNQALLRQTYPDIPSYFVLNDIQPAQAIRNVVNSMWMRQFDRFARGWTTQHSSDTPVQTLNTLKQQLGTGETDIGYLRLVNMNPPAAHAVVPLRVRAIPGLPRYAIDVYDNNSSLPDSIVVDTSFAGGNGLWAYGALNWGGTTGLSVSQPASHFLESPQLPRASGGPVSSKPNGPAATLSPSGPAVYTPAASRLLIWNGSDTAGYDATGLINDLPGALPIIPETSIPTPPMGFELPSGTYDVRIESSAPDRSVELFAGGVTFDYVRTGGPADPVRLRFSGGDLFVKSGGGGSHGMTVSAVLSSTTEDRRWVLSASTLGAVDSIELSAYGNDLYVDNYGGARNYDLALSRASAAGEVKVRCGTLHVPAGTQHWLRADWNNLATVPVRLIQDLDMEGDVVDTFYLAPTVVGVKGEMLPEVAKTFQVAPAWPNPFSRSTRIAASLPAESNVRVTIYDVQGRRVATPFDGRHDAGRFGVDWNGRDDAGQRLGAGVYFYRVEARVLGTGALESGSGRMLLVN